MRNLFSSYYRPSKDEFDKLWKEGVFIFDTNVLLNLYSYPEDVRNVFLSVLNKISERTWIPYQVGIEFHRNRFNRIKQSNQRVEKLLQTIGAMGNQLDSEVKNIELEKRNIGISDIQDRLAAVQTAHTALSEAVQLACDKLPPVSLEDPIGEEVSRLLENRVGLPPASQSELDELLADGQERFDKKIPPGFGDEKSKDEGTFRDRGITYPRKFGDLILWKQLIAHAGSNKLTKIVFVTSDSKKNDWWLQDDNRTLGPLPELIQEMKSKANVDLFWMYSADQFLQQAESYLKATEVTAETIQQIKDLSDQALSDSIDGDSLKDFVEGRPNKIYLRNAIMKFMKLTESPYDNFELTDVEVDALEDNYHFEEAQNQRHSLRNKKFLSGSRPPAVDVEQEIDIASQDYNRGILRVRVLRDTVIATGSGKLTPMMSGIPFVKAKLERAPEDCERDLVKYSAGTGTAFDFNINMKSSDYRVRLPVGEYVFSYEAKCFDVAK